jgi:hypothetical protein
MLKIFDHTPIVMPEFYKDLHKIYNKKFSFFPMPLIGHDDEKYFKYGIIWLEFYYTLTVFGYQEVLNSKEFKTRFRIDKSTLVLLKLNDWM